MSDRVFACLSAALGWTAAALAIYAGHWDAFTLGLAIFNAAWWAVATIILVARR